jgi:hypothetical protein
MPAQRIHSFFTQVKTSAIILFQTVPFIINHKLWQGFFKQRLAIIFSSITAILIPISFFDYLLFQVQSINQPLLDNSQIAASSIAESVSFSSIFDGGNKYLILLIINLLITYFSNKTIEHISGTQINLTFKELFDSFIRVIKLIIINWAYEIIIGVFLSIVLGIFGFGSLKETLMWFVQAYFLGYFFIDNYNFIFDISIKESSKIIFANLGATLLIGIVAQLLFLIPFIGSISAAFICSIAATYYMHIQNHQGVKTSDFV